MALRGLWYGRSELYHPVSPGDCLGCSVLEMRCLIPEVWLRLRRDHEERSSSLGNWLERGGILSLVLRRNMYP